MRIQTGRKAPGRLLRPTPQRPHPMVTGMLLMFSGWPRIVGMGWAYLPLPDFGAVLVWRNSREDRPCRPGRSTTRKRRPTSCCRTWGEGRAKDDATREAERLLFR